MKKYTVTGMSCAACQSRVEKAVCHIDGVKEVSVSLLTNSMLIYGDVSDEIIIDAVKKAGYEASIYNENNSVEQMEDSLKDAETPILKRRLICSLVILLPLMYVSMGHMMWNWPLPEFISHNHIYVAVIQLVLTTIILWINRKFFINGVKGILNKSPNMDTLVAIGAGASYGYSIYVLIAMYIAMLNGNKAQVMEYAHDLYFESAAMIVTLITVGKMLEAYSKGKTTNAIKGLIKLAPKTATIIVNKDGKEIEKVVNAKELKQGDIFVVKPGESVPVDGIVLEGISAIDESALTGESLPVDKVMGDEVTSATINQSGYLKCKASRVGEDTTLSQIIKLVSEASASKAPMAKVADKVSGVFVPIVIIIAIITIFVWILVGETVGFALARGISVLVISCPCALGLATPVAIMVGNGVGAKNGILYKNATAIENAGRIKNIALDKTGTITEGKPVVTDVITDNKELLLQNAYTLESKSEHPLAKAIVGYAKENNIQLVPIEDFQAVAGNGLKGIINGKMVYAGNYQFISKFVSIDNEKFEIAQKLASEGKTPMYFANENQVLGIIAVADIIKEESARAITEIKNMGIKVTMLTGDNVNTANAIGKLAGVDEVISQVLPQDKEAKIKELQKSGITAMVGDGINDAPALTRADIGMAIGAGADVAIDAADIVLVKNKLTDVVAAIRLSRGVLKNIYENLFWAFIYNIIGIPLAAGIWYPLLGIKLSPMFGAAAMSLSSFCVVINALRLNFFKLHSNKKDKKIKHKNTNTNIEKRSKMEKIILINGMMCAHCEATVKKALELLPEVDEAIVSKDENRAVVKLNKDVSDDILIKTITDKDFQVVGIE